MKRFVSTVIVLMLAQLGAAAFGQEGDLAADLHRERKELAASCNSFNVKALAGCGKVIVTGSPLRLAVENFPPGNSVGLGLGFHKEYNTTLWRDSIDSVGEGSFNGSWRAGLYTTFVFTGRQRIVVTEEEEATTKAKPFTADLRRPTFRVLAEAISLNQLAFYGIGNQTLKTDRTFFGMDHRYLGATAEVPLRFGFALFGELAGRWYDLRGRNGQNSPSIEQVFSEATAPGLGGAEAFLQTGEGIGFSTTVRGRLRLEYLAKLQQFHATDVDAYSFRRFTLSGNHEYALYRTKTETNGNKTKNKVGSVSVGGSLMESIAGAGHVVPFYLQPTLGGSDINHERKLPSYPDYRYRAPNYWLARAAFEHTVYGPLGALVWSDVGRVAVTRGDLTGEHLRHSFGVGAVLKAGNFPYFSLSFAWGGNEGNHLITDIRGVSQAKGPSLF